MRQAEASTSTLERFGSSAVAPRSGMGLARQGGGLTDRLVRGCPVVLCDADKPHSRRVERVLRSMVSEVTIVNSVSALRQPADVGLLVVNYDSFRAAERDALFKMFPREGAPPRIIIYSGDTPRAELGGLFSDYGLTNLLAHADADGEALIVTIQKILRGDIFGLEKYFPWGAEFATRALTGSGSRSEFLAELSDVAQRVGVLPRFVEQMLVAADEFSTNALYDAPVDSSGHHRFASLPRSTHIELDDGEDISITFCCDGRRLGLSIRDPFGSLCSDAVLSHLAKCFRRGPDQIDTKEGGAGLGLYFAFEALSHLVINLRPGHCTEMIGLMDVRGSYKDFVLRGKSFNVFVAK